MHGTQESSCRQRFSGRNDWLLKHTGGAADRVKTNLSNYKSRQLIAYQNGKSPFRSRKLVVEIFNWKVFEMKKFKYSGSQMETLKRVGVGLGVPDNAANWRSEWPRYTSSEPNTAGWMCP